MRWADILRSLLFAPLIRFAQRTFVSELTSGNVIYPALCAGLTSYALAELTWGNVIYSVLCAGLISYALSELTSGNVIYSMPYAGLISYALTALRLRLMTS